MARKTAREKLDNGKLPEVCDIDEAKSARFQGARTMLIPTPRQVQAAIAQIPSGQTKTNQELRLDLAKAAGADTTCPLCLGIFWRLVAEAAEEERADGAEEVTPWWRVTKDGKLNPKMPGGEERHRALLLAEGVQI